MAGIPRGGSVYDHSPHLACITPIFTPRAQKVALQPIINRRRDLSSRRRHAPRLTRATMRQFDCRIKARRRSVSELFDLDELPAETALDAEISAGHGMIQGRSYTDD